MYTKTKILLVRASTMLSSRQTSIQRGESDSDLIAYFSLDNIWKVILKKEVRNEFYKNIQRADLDSPRQELSNGGLRNVVTLTVFFRNQFFVCVCCGSNSAVPFWVVLRGFRP